MILFFQIVVNLGSKTLAKAITPKVLDCLENEREIKQIRLELAEHKRKMDEADRIIEDADRGIAEGHAHLAKAQEHQAKAQALAESSRQKKALAEEKMKNIIAETFHVAFYNAKPATLPEAVAAIFPKYIPNGEITMVQISGTPQFDKVAHSIDPFVNFLRDHPKVVYCNLGAFKIEGDILALIDYLSSPACSSVRVVKIIAPNIPIEAKAQLEAAIAARKGKVMFA